MELKIEYVPIKDLKPYPYNARRHDKDSIDAIKASIEEFGFDDPIGVWKDNFIIEGHGRYLAGNPKPLGWKQFLLSDSTILQKSRGVHMHWHITKPQKYPLGTMGC